MTRYLAVVCFFFALALGLTGQPRPQETSCTLAGTWIQQSEGLGPSTWTITADGGATESGLGNAQGRATLSGRTLRIDWTIPGYNNSGYYEWTLDSACSGSGVAVNTISGATRKTTVAKNPDAEDVAAIRAELSESPTEVWVGSGRPSMSATIFITGFRRNTADPVVIECPDATNLAGDHPDPGGDPLKRVQIFGCGATAQTYDWPVPGYGWGIMISAPEKDYGPQPGRPRDICIGTNPVRLRVSQKGAGSAFVTIAPQLVLKAGLVGGGGTYGSSNCTGDQRGTGGGGGSGTGSSSTTNAALSGRFAIQTTNGNFLTAVRGGGIQGPGAINSDATGVSGWETFESELLSDGKYAIKTVNGNYLTTMRGGGLTGADVIHTDSRRVDAWEKFTFNPLSDGSYAIQTSNGNYLTAVSGGGVGGGRGAIHSNATSIGAWEKFRLAPLGQSHTGMANRSTPTRTGYFGQMQYGYDIADGGDYQAMDLPEPRPELCEAECARDPRCKAYAYTKPGTYDYPRPRCWLKEKAGKFVPNANTVSAMKLR